MDDGTIFIDTKRRRAPALGLFLLAETCVFDFSLI